MTKEELLTLVLNSGELPTLPVVASELIAITAKEDASLSDIADLVSRDIALTAKILKVANSAFYNFPNEIVSIQQGLSIMGVNAIRSLVISFSFLTINHAKGKNAFDFEKFWVQSLTSAITAQLILKNVKGANTEEIFTAALLQNLGQLILAKTLPEQYGKMLAAMDEDQGDSRSAEHAEFGVDHCWIGHEVAKHWGIPSSLTLPILYHHTPEKFVGGDKNLILTTKAIYLSGILLNILYSDNPQDNHRQFTQQAKKLLNLKTEDIELVLARAHIEVDQSGQYFGLNMRETKPVNEILQEANIRLSLLNLDYEQINKKLVHTQIALERLSKELQEKNRLLYDLAITDGLTGVFNNRHFQSVLDKELSRAQRKSTQLALVLVDIDHFKKFNDEHGHQTGDFILTEFCQVMAKSLREYDTLARYGGEEFIIILPETSADGAGIVAEKLRNAVENASFRENSKLLRVTASFGISSLAPVRDEIYDKNTLIKEADIALYDAKKRGRNQVATYREKKKWFG
jgi:two-component system cell cycle response regulator